MSLYGGIEAGGTKIVCVVAAGPQDIRAETRFPTTTPEETIARMAAFFHSLPGGEPVSALGIGSFGPLDLDPRSPTFGYITSTPKPGWAHTDLAGALKDSLQIPVQIDTDVNAAVLAENLWGNGQGLDPLLYYTIGTGIGMGGFINGRLMHGLTHPEAGHVFIPHNRHIDPFPGICPYHQDCFEGLASGTAMQQRWGVGAENLPDDHPAWELEAEYVSLALASHICTLSPRRILLGGGVGQRPALLQRVRSRVPALLNGYVQSPAVLQGMDSYILPPGLGSRAGVLGAVALAMHG